MPLFTQAEIETALNRITEQDFTCPACGSDATIEQLLIGAPVLVCTECGDHGPRGLSDSSPCFMVL